MQRVAPLAVLLLVMAIGGCDSGKPADTKPPAAGARLCDVTDASWWYDATGAGGLTGMLSGDPLPLTNPSQSHSSVTRAECKVFADGKQVGGFVAELTSDDEVINTAQQIAKDPAENQFEVLGHKGGVEPGQSENLRRAWWTCGVTLLKVELIHPKDQNQVVQLTKDLAQHVAGVVGCPGPTPTLR